MELRVVHGSVSLQVGLCQNSPPFGGLGRVVGLRCRLEKNKAFYLLSIWSVTEPCT